MTTDQVRSQANSLLADYQRLCKCELSKQIQALIVRTQAAQHRAGCEMTSVQDDRLLGDMTGLSLAEARLLVRAEAERAISVLSDLPKQTD